MISHLKVLFNLTNNYEFEFSEKDSLNIFLTNTLEFHRKEIQVGFRGLFERILAIEQEKALEVKNQTPILIVIGNPPYSVSSQNKIDPKTEFGRFYESYKENVKKEEKNIQPLSDDYIKFLAFAHWKIRQTGKGIIGMITNNSYLDGLIHRDMRKKLLEDFDLIYILNLNGDIKKPKTTKDGEKDENVFDIQQGVAISIFVKPEKKVDKQIFYQELIGQRKEKYLFLDNHDISNIEWMKLEPKEPYCFLVPKDFREEEKAYNDFLSITQIFSKNSSGIKTHRDKFIVASTKEKLLGNLNMFINESYTDNDIDKTFGLRSLSNWNTAKMRKLVKNEGIKDELLKKYNYRIFDKQWIYFHNCLVTRLRDKLMQNLTYENLSLVTTRILSSQSFQHIFISDTIGDICFISNKGKETNYYFPLWIYDMKNTDQDVFQSEPKISNTKTSNIKKEIIDLFSSSYKTTILPEDIFCYIYAILYSNIYRQKYLEFLKIDFPRIPFAKDYELFKKLSEIGKKLIDIHLLQSNLLNNISSKFEGDNDGGLVKKIDYNAEEKRIYINNGQYFTNIEPEVWNCFIGGYQVLKKWLNDRKGKHLTDEEIKTYLKIIEALRQTIILQKEIDELYLHLEQNPKL